jgi:hypothetical protein
LPNADPDADFAPWSDADPHQSARGDRDADQRADRDAYAYAYARAALPDLFQH